MPLGEKAITSIASPQTTDKNEHVEDALQPVSCLIDLLIYRPKLLTGSVNRDLSYTPVYKIIQRFCFVLKNAYKISPKCDGEWLELLQIKLPAWECVSRVKGRIEHWRKGRV